ncbi:hypothetical protein ScPMuIL_001675 [Solemya velum]
MKLTLFEIHFGNTNAVFPAGQAVCGNVVVKLIKPMKMRSITIMFEGRGKSYWEVRSGRNTTKYRANETYITKVVPLYGPYSEGTVHPEGYHVYPFSVQLPATVPSSFEGRRGYVRYFCKATIDRPWKFDSHAKRAFTVIRPLNLNEILDPNPVPVVLQCEEAIEGCCCDNGSVVAELSLNKMGYVPGEPLIYTIKIDNKSETEIKEISLELRQVVTYTGFSNSLFSSGNPRYHVKVDKFHLFNGHCTIKKSQSQEIQRATLIPSLPPSRLDGCGIIEITYIVELRIPCGWSTVNMEKEILIGTVPLQGMGVVSPIVSAESPVPSAPPEMTRFMDAPPSYEECIFGKVQIRDDDDDEHTTGQLAWAPAYPYYSQHSDVMYGGAPPSIAQLEPPAYNE